ncbi:MAG: UvrD-helicase domain-containing protein [Muribaculaceae bacterium]|nr:UvrD-helicase domain-containing protein [Muribaculaceae bacterium]
MSTDETFRHHSYLDELNPQQRDAVEYISGPELVIAGAGSGKTRVLTYKIMHLIANGYEPWRVLALTFTNKAAREMRERITRQVGESCARRIWMGTFHSIFARILRTHADRIGFPSNYTIYDATDSKNLIKTIIKEMKLDEKVYKPGTVANAISSAKNALMSPEMYMGDRDTYEHDKRSQRPMTGLIYQAYRDRLKTSGTMDFDDLLYYMNVLLRDNDDIRRHYQEFFRYVLVDEYQDTNFAQHLIVSQLTKDTGHLCVVGDDAQSIYSFRGANISNILNLKRFYPDLRMFKLEQNYRSTENIINAAGSLISKNVEQIPKKVFSKNGAGKQIEVLQCFSDFEEASLVAARISSLKTSTGDSFEDFAILYRTNAQSRILEESLRRRNIPYRIYGGLSFFQRKEVKDAVCYLRLALNPHDEEAFKRVVNIPARKLGATTVTKVIETASKHDISLYHLVSNLDTYTLDVNGPTRKRLEDFAGLITQLGELAREYDAAEVIRRMYLLTGLPGLYQSDSTPENIAKYENLLEFMNYAAEFVQSRREEDREDEASLPEFMAEVSLATDADEKDNDSEGQEAERVTLMTIHAAKGLEFGNVFVVGVEEDLLPSSMGNQTPGEIEEERRLLYVAITRAKRFCMLSFASSRFRNGTPASTRPSRFLLDIDQRYIRLQSGTRISGAGPSASSSHPYRKPAPETTTATFHATNKTDAGSPRAFPSQRKTRQINIGNQVPTLYSVNDLVVGQQIVHPRFGTGTIDAVDGSNPMGARIIASFDEEGSKVLLLKFARFVIAN